MRGVAVVVVLLAAGGAVGVRSALGAPESQANESKPNDDGGARAAAQEHVDRGRAASDAGNLAEALAEFQAAYALVPSPKLLFNLAQIERLSGQPAPALEHYRKFLAEIGPAPDGSDLAKRIATARDAIAALESGAAAAAGEGTSPPAAAEPPPPPVEAPPPAVPEPAPAATAPALALTTTAAANPPPPARRPIYRRWYFWTAIAAVALAGGALALFKLNEPPACEAPIHCLPR